MRRRLGKGASRAIVYPRLAGAGRTRSNQTGFSTFIIESMLLFICLILVVALSVSAFAFASTVGKEATLQQKAIVLATNAAERFTADPHSVPPTDQNDGMIVVCDVEASTDEVGAMYTASITVYASDDQEAEPLYGLDVSRYVSRTSAEWEEVA